MMPRYPRDGFTLVELLVCIAIIAVLASILFPAFAGARDKARQAACQSNLHQLGVAFVLYAQDKDGYLPCPGGQSTPSGLIGSAWIQSSGAGMGKDIGGIWPYVQQRGNGSNNLWSCPNALPGPQNAWSPGQNYLMNDYLRAWHPGEQAIYPFIKKHLALPTDLYAVGLNPDLLQTSPCELILLFEGAQDADSHSVSRTGSPFFNTGPSATPPLCMDLPQNYHAGHSDFLFCDAHAKAYHPGRTWPPEEQWAFVKFNGPGFNTCATLQVLLNKNGDYHGSAEASLWNPRIGNVIYP